MASPYYPPPPAQAYRAAEESSGAGLPWWILVGLGVLVGGVAGKVGGAAVWAASGAYRQPGMHARTHACAGGMPACVAKL